MMYLITIELVSYLRRRQKNCDRTRQTKNTQDQDKTHLGGCQMDQGGQMLPFRGRQILLLLEPPLQLVDLKCKNSVSTDGYRIPSLDFNVTVNDMSNGKKSRTPISARRAGSVGSWRVRSNFGLPSGPRRDRARADGGRGLPVPG